jgi:8-oxo-dGTP pyrophosphatase MutT (NUDIX family)
MISVSFVNNNKPVVFLSILPIGESEAIEAPFINSETFLCSTSSADVVKFLGLFNNMYSNYESPEWEFPKGRRNYQEKDLDCALREFEEETGLSKNDIKIIENVMPFEEVFIGSNHKSYKHKYFLAYTEKIEDNLQNYQQTEVSKMDWKTLEECLESIRPYNLEKKQLIININKVLQEYRLY